MPHVKYNSSMIVNTLLKKESYLDFKSHQHYYEFVRLIFDNNINKIKLSIESFDVEMSVGAKTLLYFEVILRRIEIVDMEQILNVHFTKVKYFTLSTYGYQEQKCENDEDSSEILLNTYKCSIHIPACLCIRGGSKRGYRREYGSLTLLVNGGGGRN